MSTNRSHRARQCAPEVPRTRIRVLGDLQERRIRPGISLIWRRYGGGVGNRETAAGNSTDAKSHREAALGVDELQPAVCFQGSQGAGEPLP